MTFFSSSASTILHYEASTPDLKQMVFFSITKSRMLYSWMISSHIIFLKRKGKSLPPSKA